ncbi:MAG TPA: TIGR04255 family protein [Gemmataceae bacterium]|nr:TIGR04255 family protein [Gemmataceae bacterium]
MNLGKPPIVQAWIEFRFEHSAERSEWEASANKFFDMFQDAYQEREVLAQHQMQIEKVEKNQRPRVVDERVQLVGIRSFTPSKSRCLQLLRDTLTCNFTRSESTNYEGFDALKAEAMAKFRAYVEFFRPTRLLQAAIHYVDLVRIPFDKGNVELGDYFTFTQDLPQATFGTTMGFNVQYTARPPQSKDLLEVRLYNEQADPEGPTAQFRMDWRFIAYEGLSFADSEVGGRLSMGHDTLLSCFRNSFTEKGWALFEERS